VTAFLRVNQLTLPVLQSDASDDYDEIGNSDRAQDATLRIERRGIKFKSSYKMQHAKAADALAWRDLLLGRGEHFTGVTLYGSQGTPITGAGASSSATHVKFGTAALKVTSGNTAQISGRLKGTDAGVGPLLVYFRWNGSAFDNWLHGPDGSVYVNGVLSGPAGGPPPHKWATIASTGVVTLAGIDSGSSPGANADQWFGDIVLLNLYAGAFPSSWLTDWPAITKAFSDLPFLSIDGLGVEANYRAVKVKGACGSSPILSAAPAGSFAPNVHILPCHFDEV
jgi:hypothetical protein